MKLQDFKIGDPVITPMNQEAIVIGFNGDRLDLKYVEGDSVTLKPSLVKKQAGEVHFRD